MKKNILNLAIAMTIIMPQYVLSQTVIDEVMYRCQYKVITEKIRLTMIMYLKIL